MLLATWRSVRFAVVAALCLALAGCAAETARQHVESKGELLTSAGFKTVPIDTPDKLKRAELMQPMKLSTRTKNGQRRYVAADTHDCMCFYVGDQDAYERYEVLRTQGRGSHVVSDEMIDELDEESSQQLDPLIEAPPAIRF